MKQTINLIYIILALAASITVVFMEIEPALSIINFLAPEPGDRYNVTLVFMSIFLLFLLPLMIYLIVGRLSRGETEVIDTQGKTGIHVTRQRALSSGLVGIPIYLNAKKIGIVDNGKTKFFEIESGSHTVQAGKGKNASDILTVDIARAEQAKFELSIDITGIFPKYVLVKN